MYLEHGQPFADTGIVHDEHAEDPTQAFALSRVTLATHNTLPLGVFRDVDRASYDELLAEQLERGGAGTGDLRALLNSGDSWEIG